MVHVKRSKKLRTPDGFVWIRTRQRYLWRYDQRRAEPTGSAGVLIGCVRLPDRWRLTRRCFGRGAPRVLGNWYLSCAPRPYFVLIVSMFLSSHWRIHYISAINSFTTTVCARRMHRPPRSLWSSLRRRFISVLLP